MPSSIWNFHFYLVEIIFEINSCLSTFLKRGFDSSHCLLAHCDDLTASAATGRFYDIIFNTSIFLGQTLQT
jgi:hypothetical protein